MRLFAEVCLVGDPRVLAVVAGKNAFSADTLKRNAEATDSTK